MVRTFDGRRLRGARLAADVRPEHIALCIDKSVYSVHRYEQDSIRPSVAVVAAMADVLGGNVDDLLAPRGAVRAG